MTYLDLVKLIRDIGSDTPDHDAAQLINAFWGKDRQWCLLNKNEPLSYCTAFERAVQDLNQHIPIQYIIGEAWFYGNRFTVTPACLIPQPDTEHVVDRALKHMKNQSMLLDLCTGSGCIAISVLKQCTSSRGVAVDISKDALEIAKSNAVLHGCSNRLDIVEANALAGCTDLVTAADVIVSNPPYIATDVIDTLPKEVQNEPRLALDGGEDGLTFYRHFILNLTKYMKKDAVMILEIGFDQAELIKTLCETANVSLTLHRDFGGNFRVAEISHIR